MTKQIRVRPADLNDYESVLAIGPYFKAAVHPVTIMYHSYFSDPQAHPFVTEIDGEVVRLLFLFYLLFGMLHNDLCKIKLQPFNGQS